MQSIKEKAKGAQRLADDDAIPLSKGDLEDLKAAANAEEDHLENTF